MNQLRRFLICTLAAVSIALIALSVGMPVTPVAEAAFESCRADPIVYLSDGTTLTVTVDIGADVSAVKKLGYSIHTPPGVTMVKVEYTPLPGFTGKEKIDVKDDAQPGQYVTDTVVKTTDDEISVTATTYLASQAVAVSGFNGQHLQATLYR